MKLISNCPNTYVLTAGLVNRINNYNLVPANTLTYHKHPVDDCDPRYNKQYEVCVTNLTKLT